MGTMENGINDMKSHHASLSLSLSCSKFNPGLDTTYSTLLT